MICDMVGCLWSFIEIRYCLALNKPVVSAGCCYYHGGCYYYHWPAFSLYLLNLCRQIGLCCRSTVSPTWTCTRIPWGACSNVRSDSAGLWRAWDSACLAGSQETLRPLLWVARGRVVSGRFPSCFKGPALDAEAKIRFLNSLRFANLRADLYELIRHGKKSYITRWNCPLVLPSPEEPSVRSLDAFFLPLYSVHTFFSSWSHVPHELFYTLLFNLNKCLRIISMAAI